MNLPGKVPGFPMVIEFFECTSLHSQIGQGACQLLRLWKEIGVEVLTRHPERQIDSEGDLLAPVRIGYDVLAQSADAPKKQARGSGSFQFIQSYRNVSISQLPRPELTNADDVAFGLRRFAKLVHTHLHPNYGWIDEAGENSPGIRSIRKQELRFIFWANVFGPPWVEKFGRDFLLKAPGWKKETLDDGGILYVVTERYTDWYNNRPKEVLNYFKKKAPDVKLYRSTGVG